MRDNGFFPREIAATLNADGVPYVSTIAKRQGKWGTAQIEKMLRAPVYAGYVPYHDQLFEGKHEAIVNRALWKRVQRLVDSAAKARTREKNSPVPFPLRGLLKCGKCGGAMSITYTVKNGKMHRYYACARKVADGRHACDCTNLNADAVEDYLKGELAFIADVCDLPAAMVQALPEWNPALVGDCVFNLGMVLDKLDTNELAAVFKAAFESVTWLPDKSAFIIKRAV